MLQELMNLILGPYVAQGLVKFEKKADKVLRLMANIINDMLRNVPCHRENDLAHECESPPQGTDEDTPYSNRSESQQYHTSSSPSQESSDDSESILCQPPLQASANEDTASARITEADARNRDENSNGNNCENFNVSPHQSCTSPITSKSPPSGKQSCDSEQIVYTPLDEELVLHDLPPHNISFKQDSLQTGTLPMPLAPQSPIKSSDETHTQSPQDDITGIDSENNIRSQSQYTTLTSPSTVLANKPEVRRLLNCI